MNIGDLYPKTVTVRLSEFTSDFIEEQAEIHNMKPSTFCRTFMENLSRFPKKNGDKNAVDYILSKGFDKAALENEIHQTKPLPSIFEKKEEKKKETRTRKIKNSSVVHHMHLPDGSEVLTHNLRAFMRDWCKENSIVDWESIFESAKTGFKSRTVTKIQRAFRSRYPYIERKLVKDAKGEFRSFKKGQTSHARVVDLEEYEKKLKAPKKIRIPKKIKIGLKKPVDENTCPDCGGELVLREGPYGEFYGCSNYINPKFKCEFKKSLEIDNDKVMDALEGEEEETPKSEEPKQDLWLENGNCFLGIVGV